MVKYDHDIVSKNLNVLRGMESLLNEPSAIQVHTVFRSEGIEAVNAVRKIIDRCKEKHLKLIAGTPCFMGAGNNVNP